MKVHEAEVLIAGGGLAGLVAAFELLEAGRSVLLLEKGPLATLGGLAKESFGGVHLIGTPHQRKLGIRDDAELALRDWERVAAFGAEDHWPRRWAEYYCAHSETHIHRFLHARGVRFLPLVNWAERGFTQPGNRVPRWHIVWGTGHEIIARLLAALEAHPHRAKLDIRCDHEVSDLLIEGGQVRGVLGKRMDTGEPFEARAEQVLIASGGMCGGDLSTLRANWHGPWGQPPKVILNGAHAFGDGLLHAKVQVAGGRLTHMDRQWHYPAGIHHPAKRRPDDGLSLVPPRSALWLDAHGRRIGPLPLVGNTDTRALVEAVLQSPGQYSWQLLNWRIALKELAVSGCDFMTAFRHKRKLRMLRDLAFGNRELVECLVRDCPEDIVVADSLPELMERMDARGLEGLRLDRAGMSRDIADYDAEIDRGPAFFTDDQLRRLAQIRAYRGDRLRTCKFQKILDPKAGPLVAIREFILSRKSLGGIQTDLACRVLREDGEPIPGLYALGEAAGFGGGGIHGRGSLEGTFLGACVLTGRLAAQHITGRTIL